MTPGFPETKLTLTEFSILLPSLSLQVTAQSRADRLLQHCTIILLRHHGFLCPRAPLQLRLLSRLRQRAADGPTSLQRPGLLRPDLPGHVHKGDPITAEQQLGRLLLRQRGDEPLVAHRLLHLLPPARHHLTRRQPAHLLRLPAADHDPIRPRRTEQEPADLAHVLECRAAGQHELRT